MLKNFLEKVQKKGPAGRKRQDRKGNRTIQKNKTGDSKVESNDSPEIPDRGETFDFSGLPSGHALGLYRSSLGFDLTWSCLLCSSTWAELSVC